MADRIFGLVLLFGGVIAMLMVMGTRETAAVVAFAWGIAVLRTAE